MQLKKKMTSLGCAAYCTVILFWPLLIALIGAGLSAAFRGVGGWRAWLFGSGMDWQSWVLLGFLLECLWLIAGFQGAKPLLARREQEDLDEQEEPCPKQ